MVPEIRYFTVRMSSCLPLSLKNSLFECEVNQMEVMLDSDTISVNNKFVRVTEDTAPSKNGGFFQASGDSRKGYFKVVPVYIGTLAHDQLTVVARRFRDYLEEPENAFIFSASLCHWGDIYGFSAQIPDAPTILDSIKAFDKRAIAAMRELRFRPFDEFLLDTKAKVLDNQIIALLLFMVRQLLNVNLHALISMDEEKVVNQMRKLARFKLMGQAWSYPDVTSADSCISYVSAVVELDEERYIPEEPSEPNPLNKLC
ncbi:hypothetical protein CLF_101548 [Clonorchis sinensis]|uniref:Protein MEMO1 n=1 Tax=Clonorchis sinensis TaxID=79923 RepID=G7Y605_CLOSI|nr:hypothetical protein CLF_101548 [Clonorchis sinensis]